LLRRKISMDFDAEKIVGDIEKRIEDLGRHL